MNLMPFRIVLLTDPKNREAFMSGAELNRILEEYGGNICRFCYSLCKNENDADDLFQETCLKLLKSDFRIKSREETLSFLYKTCLNAYRNAYRAAKRRGEMEIHGVSSEYIENIPDKKADAETYEELYRAVDTLPYKYRTVITLSYFEGLSEKNVSNILGVPPGTVKSRLYKAKQLLKKELMKNENN